MGATVQVDLGGASRCCSSTEHWRMRISLAAPGCFVAMASTSARACEAIPMVWAAVM